ncbi:protein monoglycylase TTLL8 [Camelus dromedarius]|uniref:protein monoglycylase TTLL8 n=1 Tax=Camelus dromedarius TaxID=9838 RepID=UPI00311963C4
MEPGERKRLPSAAASEGEQREHKLKRGIPQDLLSSPKLDKYKIARQLTDKAVKEKKIFSIYGHYPVIRAALRRKGWVEKKFYFLPKPVAKVEGDGEGVAENRCSEGKENQEEALENTDDIHDVMSRLVKNEMPYFLWTLKRDIVDYHSLSCDQMLNHYGKTAAFTTKIGLCVNMRTLPWYVQADPDSFFPRCYGLCTESDKQEFLDDFRRTVASSILKWVVSQQNGSKSKRKSSRGEAGDSDPSSKQVPENTRSRLMGLSGQLVDAACKVCEAYLGRLEHKDIDLSEDAAEDLTEDEWKDLTQQYYSLVCGNAFISSSRSRFSQCQALLNKITSVNPQTEIDGLRNIWIIKPAAKSRGRDIVCMNHVEEILELVAADHLPAKDKWVVQKYIETPLLIYDTKFDIRQWFLVTDWNPLTIWFYKESYLRFSTRRFSLDNLDSAIHLCNNSIQKHLKNDKGRSPLLPCHNTWTSTRFQEYLQKRGRGAVWSSIIYPSMKRAIANTMMVAQGRVEPRKNSFELYGADFILGRDFKPWLIEINSSPTMHASTPVTAQLCAQVQEDTIKVVVDRRVDRNCDTGNFELLWRQPAVELPPFQGSDLFVEGVGARKAKRQMPPISTFDSASSLSNIQPLKERCPSALPGLAPAPPRTALQPDLRMKDEKVLACTLPLPLNRPAGRSAKVSCDLSEPGSGMELPTCHLQHLDHTAPNTGLTRVESDKRWDPNLLKVHPLRSVLPSMKTVEGAQCPPPRPSGNRAASFLQRWAPESAPTFVFQTHPSLHRPLDPPGASCPAEATTTAPSELRPEGGAAGPAPGQDAEPPEAFLTGSGSGFRVLLDWGENPSQGAALQGPHPPARGFRRPPRAHLLPAAPPPNIGSLGLRQTLRPPGRRLAAWPVRRKDRRQLASSSIPSRGPRSPEEGTRGTGASGPWAPALLPRQLQARLPGRSGCTPPSPEGRSRKASAAPATRPAASPLPRALHVLGLPCSGRGPGREDSPPVGPPAFVRPRRLALRGWRGAPCDLPGPAASVGGLQRDWRHLLPGYRLGSSQHRMTLVLAPGLPRGGSRAECIRPAPFSLPSGVWLWLPGALRAPPCLVCRGLLPPAGACKRCSSFRAAIQQGSCFVPLGGERGGGLWTP